MLPVVFGPQHARVPPSSFPIVHEAVLPVARRLFRVRPDTAVVLVGDGVLDIRFGRLKLCTALTNVADVTTGATPLPRSVIGVRLSPLGHGLILGTARLGRDVDESWATVRVRFLRPVSVTGPAVVIRARWVAVAAAAPTHLVAALPVVRTPDASHRSTTRASYPADQEE